MIEVLAALLLVAIVLPVVMRGVSVGTTSAAASRRRTEAASLAQSKLSELVATEGWRGGVMAGQFDVLQGDNAAEFGWRADVRNWNEQYVKELAVHVTWSAAAGEQRVTLTSLVYEGRPKPPGEEQEAGAAAPPAGGGTP